MDTPRKRRSDAASPTCAERNTYFKSKDLNYMSGCWSERPFLLKLALTTLLAMALLLPLYLSFNTSSLRERLIGSTLLAAMGKTTEEVRSEPDETLEGLLLPSVLFKDNKCISRSQEYSLRRRTSPYKPSQELISTLREYERRHRRCAQEARNFSPSNNATEQDFGECRFLVWIAAAGLGNRVMTLASAFVYALLTDRVLLIEGNTTTDELFCEPFPRTSWLLPETFPNQWMRTLGANSSVRFGALTKDGTLPSPHNGYAYINLMHDLDNDDEKFFCAHCQISLSRFPWLFVRSNLYFVPSLHFAPAFHAKLEKLFPERETVFHHIVRYLLHPSDSVWSLISRFYKANLAGAQRKVGLQIRYLIKPGITLDTISDLVFSCTLENKLLPNVTHNQDHVDDAHEKNVSTSVLVASLHEVFHERIREFYLNHSSTHVYTASHEESQDFESLDHNKKAVADMYLLSFSDTLVTTAWSTFGYVAQGISGVTPWILTHLESRAEMEADIRIHGYCTHGLSIEPCFHRAPALDCDNKGWGYDPAKIYPFIQHCEDAWWGIKIMDPATSHRRL